MHEDSLTQTDERLDPQQQQAVLKLATRLQQRYDESMTLADIIKSGEEAGLSREAIEQAYSQILAQPYEEKFRKQADSSSTKESASIRLTILWVVATWLGGLFLPIQDVYGLIGIGGTVLVYPLLIGALSKRASLAAVLAMAVVMNMIITLSVRFGMPTHMGAQPSFIMAYELIKSGAVASHGATSTVLSNSHNTMRTLIDRAVAEVRMNGDPSIETEVLQVFSLLSEVESSCMPEANAKKVSMTVSADTDLRINADHHLMASAISNLLLNAIKFTKPDGTVALRASLEGAAVMIEIEDQGGGVDEITLLGLFKPFVRNVNSEGLGLGLTIARRAIELNGGDLSARNIAGKGCVFTIRIKALPKLELA